MLSNSNTKESKEKAFGKNLVNSLGLAQLNEKVKTNGLQNLETSTVGSYEQTGLSSPRSISKSRGKSKYENHNAFFINIFNHISENKTSISCTKMRSYLIERGFLSDDPRWKNVYKDIEKVDDVNISNFDRIFSQHITDLQKCYEDSFVIESFTNFKGMVEEIFKNQLSIFSGENAQYIPQLARQDPEKWGLSFCSIDGQRFSFGDCEDDFCIQSCSKPINYGIAVEGVGLETFHNFVGKEPSGRAFNSVALTSEGIPYNPMVNSGAIMTCSLVEKDLNIAEKFEKVLLWWKRLAGGLKPGFDNSTFLSEFETADNNFHLAYYMKSQGLFPEGTNLKLNLQFYFQCCSIEMNCKKLAIVAATLANGGVCPITHEKIFSGTTTKNILSLMYSCGMYDYSGQFAFKVGLPAKSGVSGCVMVVVPSVGGFCTWSPRLDKYGNSARGIGFFEDLVKKFSFHNFDIVHKFSSKEEEVMEWDNDDAKNSNKTFEEVKKEININSQKIDPIRKNLVTNSELISQLLFASMENDVNTIRNLIMKNVDVNLADYDSRTALHVAASEGHFEACELLLAAGASLHAKDRFSNTPVEDAKRCKHTKVSELFKKF